MSPQVHDSQNNNFFRINPIEQAVGKSADHPAAYVLQNEGPPHRVLPNIKNCRIQSLRKIHTQPSRPGFIVFRSIPYFLTSLRKEPHRLHLRESLISRMASSAG